MCLYVPVCESVCTAVQFIASLVVFVAALGGRIAVCFCFCRCYCFCFVFRHLRDFRQPWAVSVSAAVCSKRFY